MAVAAMVIVNNPAVGAPYVYTQLRHAAWDGWTFADTIFPAFLFMVGASLALSGRRPTLSRTVRRVVVLVALGLLVNAAPLLFARGLRASVLADLRLPGVLQRIALSEALAVAVLAVTPRRWQLPAAAALLAVAWLVLTKVAVPGRGAGHLTPALNIEGWVDRRVFGAAHLYRSGTVGYDPEGLVGTVAATANVLIGYWAGRCLRSSAWLLAIIGTLAVTAGTLWGRVLPINKRLSTPSYALVMAGIGLCVLAVLHAAFDRPGRLRHAAVLPWRVLGANALVVYVGSELTGAALSTYHHPLAGRPASLSLWMWGAWLRPHVGARLATVAFGALVLVVWWVVASILYRRHVFIRA
jgi:predicted acyltransferase